MTDAAARARAATDYGTNLLVVAGAGTGKTSLLVERFLNQIIEMDLDIAEAVALTFTEKAATEMQTRVEAGFEKLAFGSGESAEADRAFLHLSQTLNEDEIRLRAKRAMANLARARIFTIHRFCAGVLRNHPVESSLDPDFAIDEGGALRRLFQESWRGFLLSDDGPEGLHRERWAEALERLDIFELQDIAYGLVDACANAHDFNVDDAVIFEPVQDLLVRIDLFSLDGDSGPERYLAAARPILKELLNGGSAAARQILSRTSFQPKRGRERDLLSGTPPTAKHHPDEQNLALETHRFLNRLHHTDDELLNIAVELVRPFALRFRAESQLQGILSFHQLLVLTRDLFQGHPELCRKLSESIRVLFVDEFQDTDPVQYDIVLALARQGADGLEAGKLFIVGDPKQSIYRFRGADIAAYHGAAKRILDAGGIRLELTTNWRSVPALVASLDPIFTNLLTPQSERDENFEPGYSSLESGRSTSSTDSCIELWTLEHDAKPVSAARARASEGEWIARWIESENVQPGETAILLRALTDVDAYAEPLRRRGIPLRIEGGSTQERPEILQLRALLRALANPNDGPAVLGILRSPLGATPDRELLDFRRSNSASWCYLESKPDPELFPNLSRTFEWLRIWNQAAERIPTEKLFQFLQSETPLLALHAAANDGGIRIENLIAAFSILQEAARRSPGATLSKHTENFERGLDFSLPESNENSVRILSIHAAKGRQFPFVFMPDLGRTTAGGDARLGGSAQVKELRSERALAIHTQAGHSLSWLRHEYEEKMHAVAESKRLFYVACTRAMDRLFFVHVPRTRQSHSAMVNYFEHATLPQQTLELADAIPQAMPDRRAPSALTQPKRTVLQDAKPTGNDAQEIARRAGDVLHDMLERWDFETSDSLADHLDVAVARASQTTWVATGKIRAKAESQLQRLMQSELPAYLKGVDLLGRELPLLIESGQLKRIDLLYRDPDGRLVVADYKTDARPNVETEARYRAQLETYAAGLVAALPQEPAPALELLYVTRGERKRI